MAKLKTEKRTGATHSFTVVLSGFTELSEEIEDALFRAGCDDALLGLRNGVPFLDFDREAGCLIEAVLSAIRDVARSGSDATVVRIEPDDLVSMSEIARRLGRSRESVRLLWSGERGPGDFPAPVSNLRGGSPLWSWAQVVNWMLSRRIDDRVDRETCETAVFVALANEALASADGPLPAHAQRFNDLAIDEATVPPAKGRVPSRVARLLRELMDRPTRRVLERSLREAHAVLADGERACREEPK